MDDVNEITYAAIITVELPGMAQPATVTVSLRPPDRLETAPGHLKPLRDCTLADLRAFAEAIEAQLWEQYKTSGLAELAGDDLAHLKITILNDDGEALALRKEEVLGHAIAAEQEADTEADRRQEAGTDLAAEASSPGGEAGQPEEIDEKVELPPATIDGPTVVNGPTVVDEETEVEAEEGEPAEEAPAERPAEESVDDGGPPDEGDAGRAESVPVAPAVERDLPPEATAGQDERPGEAITGEDGTGVAESVLPPELRIAGLRRPLGHSTKAAVDILINEPALREAQSHALSSLDREVAGVLVGPQPEKQPDGRYVVHVTDTIIAEHTRMQGASVTYTPESWRYVTDKLNERYPEDEAVIVGWYHTHPGFGIFLSGMDLFIHKHFFTQTWHIALVLDPLARRSGFFCWDRARAGVEQYDFPWPEWADDSW